MQQSAEPVRIEHRSGPFEGEPIVSGADYVICRVDPADSAQEETLLNMGLRFLDRLLCFEIDLSGFTPAASALPGIEFVCDREYTPEVYALAHDAYTADRRFHLEPVFNQPLANRVIDGYIDSFKARGLKIYKAVHGEELLGFTMVDEEMDPRGRLFENLLGATRPGIKGRAIAGPLYSAMLTGEKDRFRRYLGRVSSSNLASINLHCQLGGRVTRIYDEFIYDNNGR